MCVKIVSVLPSTDDFTAKVITGLERLTRPPQLIRGFFGVPNLRHITSYNTASLRIHVVHGKFTV